MKLGVVLALGVVSTVHFTRAQVTGGGQPSATGAHLSDAHMHGCNHDRDNTARDENVRHGTRTNARRIRDRMVKLLRSTPNVSQFGLSCTPQSLADFYRFEQSLSPSVVAGSCSNARLGYWR